MFRSALQNRKFESKSSIILMLIILLVVILYDINAIAQANREDTEFGWFAPSNPPNEIFNDVIVDIDETIWAIADSGNIYFSSNVSHNFNLQYDVGTKLIAIDSDQGMKVVVGAAGFISTKKNNSDWSNGIQLGTFDLLDVEIKYPKIWVISSNSSIYYSNDTGSTWSIQQTPGNSQLNAISFINDQVGWTVGNNGTILKTENSGFEWGLDNIGETINLNDVFTENGTLGPRLWIAGDNGTVLLSTLPNLGTEFLKPLTRINENLFKIASPVSGVAYISGANGTILGFKGGYEAVLQKLNGTFEELNGVNFYALAFVNSDNGIAVGDAIYYTLTGGGLIDISEEAIPWGNLRFYTSSAVPRLWRGLQAAIKVVFVALFIGFFMGLTFATMRTVKNPILNIIATFYSDFFRNTPLLVQLSFIVFGLPRIGIQPPLYWRAVMALAFNTAAYQSEIIRSGILAIPKGQMEAARSLGMSNFQAMRYVILPQAVRITIPPLANEFVNMFLNSSLLSVIGYEEITRIGNIITSQSFLWARTFVYVAATYFIVTYTLTRILRKIEMKLRIPGLGGGQL